MYHYKKHMRNTCQMTDKLQKCTVFYYKSNHLMDIKTHLCT